MYIHERDFELLKTFIKREAQDFSWAEGVEGPSSIEFQKRIFDEINNYEADEGVDYVVIKSISNLGLVDRELKLTSVRWHSSKNLLINLPPNPRNGVCNFRVIPK